MRIVEQDFVMIPENPSLFNLAFLKKVKDEETGEMKMKPAKVYYGLSLSSCIRSIVRHRVGNKFESESPCLIETLKEIIKLDKEITNLCKETQIENFDSGE